MDVLLAELRGTHAKASLPYFHFGMADGQPVCA
jgi:hypothetical protein